MNSRDKIDCLLDITDGPISSDIEIVKSEVPSTLDEDKANVKSNLYNLSDNGMTRLKSLNTYVDDMPSPQLIDSYTKLMKTIADINMNLLKLDQTNKSKDETKTVSNTQNNYYDMSELKKKIQ